MKPTETQNPKKLHINKIGVWWTCNQTVRRDVVLISKNTRLNRRRKLKKKKRSEGVFSMQSPHDHTFMAVLLGHASTYLWPPMLGEDG